MRMGLREVALLLALVCGCQSAQVQRMANQLVSAVPDLYEQQVLDNLAMVAAKPSALPYFGTATQGTAANTRTLSASYSPNVDFITAAGYYFSRWVFDKQTATFGGMTASADTFQISPVSSPDKLLLIQSALHRALGTDDAYTGMLLSVLQRSSKWAGYQDMVRPGWFRVGCKKDVPKGACYVGRYCDTYVYVPPGNLEQLKNFTLAILDISTIDLSSLTKTKEGVYGSRNEDFPRRESSFPFPSPPTPP